jgi:hypothetical protein
MVGLKELKLSALARGGTDGVSGLDGYQNRLGIASPALCRYPYSWSVLELPLQSSMEVRNCIRYAPRTSTQALCNLALSKAPGL